MIKRGYKSKGRSKGYRTQNTQTYLLDTFAVSPYLAYSTRKLKSSATYAMRVRNTITTTVYEIPFGGDGFADFSALNSAQLHEVQIWYDQSGNGRDGIQLSGNPLSVLGFNLIDSKPAIQLYSTSVRYVNLGDLSALTAGEMHYVAKCGADPAPSTGRSWNLGAGGGLEHIPYLDGTIYDNFGSTSRPSMGNPATSLANWHLYSIYSTTNDRQLYLNGTSVYSDTSNTVGFPASSFINGNTDGRDAAELILFSQKLGTTDRDALFSDINTAFTLY